MNKYIAPEMEKVKIEVEDILTASGVTIQPLEGVDSGDSKSAVFSVMHWF